MTINKDEAIKTLSAWAEEAVDLLASEVPEANCSCHISPPCGDCVNWSHHREVVEKLRAALAATSHIAPDAAAIQAVSPEVVAHMWQHDETGRIGFVDDFQVQNGWEKGNPRLSLVAKLGRIISSPAIAPEASELPPLPKPECLLAGVYAYRGMHMASYARAAIAMHRAAAAKPTAQQAIDFIEKRADDYLRDNASLELDTGAIVFSYGEAGRDYHSSLVELADDLRTNLAAAEPVPTDLRPTDDALWDKTLADRDNYSDWADKLAEGIAEYFNAEIGEHSNMNCPWTEALEVIQSATKPAASEAVGVQTDQAHVMPPFAAPASQQGSSEAAEIDVRYEFERWMSGRGESVQYIGNGFYSDGNVDDQAVAFSAGVALASGFREGRDANDNDTNLAAPAAPTDAGVLDKVDAERYRWLKMFASPGAQSSLLSTPWGQWDSFIDSAKSSPQAPKPEGSGE